MRGLKKFTSLLLALFIVLGNIVPAFADEIVKSNEKNVVEQSSQSNEENQKNEDSKDEKLENKVPVEKENDDKSLENKNFTSPSEKPTTFQRAPVEPGWGENRVIVQVNLHGLKGKEFNFSKIFPKEKIPDGPSMIINFFNEDTFEDELIGKEKFTLKNTRLDFGIHQQVKIDDFEIYLDDNSTENHEGKIIENQSNRSGGHDGTSVFNYDIYEVQNTNAKFKTIDKDGKTIENPKNLTVTYKLGDKLKANQKLTSDINDEKDMLEGERFKSFKWEGNYDGTNMPKVSLENTQNGYFIDEDYAYKILEQKQKDDDKSNPLEVTLVKKPIVSTTNPNDSDYVKVEFLAGKNGSINEGETSTYWVLNGVNVHGLIKAPQVTAKDGYEFLSWNPNVKENYTANASYTAQYKVKEKNYEYLTYSGDTIEDSISAYDKNYMRWFSLVDNGDERAIGDGKSVITLDSDGFAKIKMDPIYHYTEKVAQKVSSKLIIAVENNYGDKILATEEKEIRHKKYVFSQDYYGNKSWVGVNITIKNQNTKGTVTPKEKETFKDIALTKEEIIEAVEDGEFSYNSDVPKQNKSGANALHREVEGKNLLNSEKVNGFSISDADYKELDFSKIGDQEVPVTITYLDNSKSTVKVKIKIKENVPTGLTNDNKNSSKILLFVGFVGIVVSAFNFRKKFLKNYE